MKTDFERFQETIAALDAEDIDGALSACFRLIASVAEDYGVDGQRARRLLRLVAEMIDVYV